MPIDSKGILEAGKAGALNLGVTDTAEKIGDAGNPFLQDSNKSINKILSKMNTSYSGCDINAIINLNGKLLQLGNLSTISYSIHREKQPVRTLGRIYPKAQVRGTLTIAGSLIFTVFDQHVLAELRNIFDYEHNIPDLQKSLLPHQFPPFDVVITYTNEYGYSSYMRIYGIEIVDEGQTHSINDMITENMMQYVAKDIDLMLKTDTGLSNVNLTFGQALFTSDRGTGVSQTVNLKDREKVKRELAEFNEFLIQLEQEVVVWRNGQSVTNPWPDANYLNIYKIGGIHSLSDAEIFLAECKLNYKDLEKIAETYTNTNYGNDPRREIPNDYSVYNQK